MIHDEVHYSLVHLGASELQFSIDLKSANRATLEAAISDIDDDRSKELVLKRQLKKVIELELAEAKGVTARQQRVLTADLAILEAEREAEKADTLAQTAREDQIKDAYLLAGEVRALTFTEKVVTVARLMRLKLAKETKVYRDLPNIGTWDKYCNYLQLDRHTIDEQLRQLNVFGEQFLETCHQFSVSHRNMRQLRLLNQEGETISLADDGKTITIEGQIVPLDEEHAPDLEEAIGRVLDRNKKLEKGFDAAVKEVTKELQLEKKAYVERIKALEPYEPHEDDREWSVKILMLVRQQCTTFSTGVSKFILDPRMKEDRQLQAQIDALITEAELTLKDLRDRFESEYDIYGD